ncbi:hypothetical protein EVAR_58049_1 [Eumeta japonica]|uniref:Proton-coupled folate transporter n=1 Tax=Eumeta variegata TaxID=151549 RepID=A0A4C1YXK1_EUMVA|nr:hypothetical protein EVAR_58049_1 [Eumeta japonica]
MDNNMVIIKDSLGEKVKEVDLTSFDIQKKSLLEKISYIKSNITVEPVVAGLIIPSVISRFAMGNFNLDKACKVNKKFGDEICESLIKKEAGNYSDYEQQVQELISSIDIWKGVIHMALPCIIIIFLGAWSDRTGKRKICILMPIFGEILTAVNNLVNVYFFYEIPVHVTIFLETFFTAITGSFVTLYLGVFSYISDITTEDTRTFRVGLVNICMTTGLPVGIALGGILVQRMGYYGVFSLTSFMFIAVFMYGCFYLKEPAEILKQQDKAPVARDKTEVTSFFNTKHIAETVRVAYKRREGNARADVILVLFVTFVLFGPNASEHGIMYLFMRNRLNWDIVKFSIYSSYSIILHTIGTLFSITVFSKRLQFPDSLLCLISCSSKFVGSIWIAFVKTDLEMYLVPVVEILNATTFTSLRSMVSKLVEKEEIARANSMFSLVETIASLIFHPLYSWLYMVTLYTLPGAVFLFSAAMVVPAAVVLIGTMRRPAERARRRGRRPMNFIYRVFLVRHKKEFHSRKEGDGRAEVEKTKDPK